MKKFRFVRLISKNKLEGLFLEKNFVQGLRSFFHGCSTTNFGVNFFYKKIILYFFSRVIFDFNIILKTCFKNLLVEMRGSISLYLDECDALHGLVPFVRFKKREKHLWRSGTFSQVAG